jgi:hypothetical protein
MLLILISTAACCIILLITLSWPMQLFIIAMIAISTIYAVLYHGLLLLPWSCVALNINTKNQLQLICKDGRSLTVAMHTNSVATPYLTVINCHVIDISKIKILILVQRFFTLHLVILPDAINAKDYRKLRVWLRWGYSR